MTTELLYRHRDRLVVGWLLAGTALCWPPRGWLPSGAFVLAGLLLRLWARRHIGPHSRGRILSSTERSVGGPYRWFGHPLYLANLLVASGIVLAVAGPVSRALIPLAGPFALYLFLAVQESRLLRRNAPPARPAAGSWRGMRMRSEWASVLPPVLVWSLVLAAARP